MQTFIAKYFKGDKVIWIVIFFLTIFSMLAVYSSTGTLAYKFQQGNTVYYFIRHLLFLSLGIFFIFIVHHIPYRFWSRISQILFYISLPLLGLTISMGTSINSASRWLTLPGIGVTMQTSDIAKLALIMYIARILSMKQDTIKDFYSAFVPIIWPVLLVCALILPANFSTAAILLVTCVILMFVGRINIKHLLILILSGVAGISIFILVVINSDSSSRVGTWKRRIEAFTGDGGDSYQSDQAKIAIVRGGIIGAGPGNSVQRNYLPHPYSDFIYAIIIEEYGIVGGIIILFMYLFLLYRAGIIVRRCERTFPAFLTFGLSIMLVFQAMINMAVAVNLFPVTGQPLPLVSMGGTSLLFTSTALGIILSVSRELSEKKDIVEESIEELNTENNEQAANEKVPN